MTDWTKDYGPAEPVEAVKAWGIYASYKGDASDSAIFVYCSTYELAEEAKFHLQKWDEDDEGDVVGPDGEIWEVCIPSCEGWEFRKSFQIDECAVNPAEVSQTMAEVLTAISQ